MNPEKFHIPQESPEPDADTWIEEKAREMNESKKKVFRCLSTSSLIWKMRGKLNQKSKN